MGRESRLSKSRLLRNSDEAVYCNAKEMLEEAKLIETANRLGLILPRIVLPDRSK